MEERNYWLGFSVFSGIGPMKFKTLLTRFGSAKNAWEASKSDLEKVIGERLAEKFDEFRHKFSIKDYINQLEKKDVSFIILTDKEYPKLLKKIRNPPFVLYIKGNKEILLRQLTDQDDNVRAIAVVGTRRTTQYGREVTKMFSEALVDAGFTIVSGLAMGIDAISHMTALENKGSPRGEAGKTIAVLGCGVDCCNPAENLRLYNDIIQKGSIILSELPLGHPPTKGSFPSRNRIIAGLSNGVLVTEGAEDSGSLITADYAIKFGRKVFAVPGPITSSMSKGPYKLISKGAKLVTSASDILKELKFEIRNSKSETNSKSKIQKGDTKEEQRILDLLQNEPMHFDQLVRRTKVNPSKLGSTLSLMEVKGLVKSLYGGMFAINN